MRVLVCSFFLVAALLVSLYGFAETGSSGSTAASASSVLIPVQASPAVLADVPRQIVSLGTLTAPQSVTLSSEVDGRVQNIYFKNGQQVVKGIPVLQLDNTAAQLAYDKAFTTLKTDQKNLERLRQAADAVSPQQVDTQKAKVDQDGADLKSKQAALDQTKIIAPISGTLGAFKTSEGDYIRSGDSIVTLVNTKQLRVEYTVSADSVTTLQRGQVALVTVDSYPNKTFAGTVTYISPTIDSGTHTIAVQAIVPNPKNLLRPGMFVHVAQQIGIDHNVVRVPQLAVSADVKGYHVFRVVGNHIVQTPVKLGSRSGDNVAVLSGLKSGDLVVVSDQQNLQDGMQVKVEKVNISAQPKAKKTKSNTSGAPQSKSAESSSSVSNSKSSGVDTAK